VASCVSDVMTNHEPLNKSFNTAASRSPQKALTMRRRGSAGAGVCRYGFADSDRAANRRLRTRGPKDSRELPRTRRYELTVCARGREMVTTRPR
jgi:hypothetical protein